AQRFLDFFSRSTKRPVQTFAPEAEVALQAYSWPGNIRELRNVIERISILWPARVVDVLALPERMLKEAPQVTAARLGGNHTLEEIERAHVLGLLSRTASLEEAARILGIDVSTLYRKRKKYEES